MSLSQKDAVNLYLVNTGAPHCIPWSLLRSQTSAKKTNSERIKELEEKNSGRIMELEEKNSDLRSLLSEKTKSFNDQLEKWNKREKELESTIETKKAIYYDQQIREQLEFQNIERKLKNQLLEKQKEINDLAVHLIVLTNEVDNYLQNDIDEKRLKNTKVFMSNRLSKIDLSKEYNVLRAIEVIRDALQASREQQRKEEGKT